MGHATVDMNIKPGQYIVSSRTKTIYSILMFIGFVVFVIGLKQNQERVWASYLTSLFFFTNFALGGLLFCAIQYVVKAGWSVNVRRLAESLTAFLPMAFFMFLLLLFSGHSLYEWFDAAKMQADPILIKKIGYLNKPFFVIRIVGFFLIWLFFCRKIVGSSLLQDQNGDISITSKLIPYSIAFIILFALSYSLFSVDALMSLDPHWYSTMFGVYCFAGLFQSTFAVIILLTLWLKNKGLLNGFVKPDHLHDLGKFLKGFTIFMAYIGFSQFMLIWYANIPEETEFFLHRAHGSWMLVSLSLLVFKFIVPFLVLLPMKSKRSPAHLILMSALIIIMEYVDIYWLVYPNVDAHHPIFGLYELGMLAGFAGAFIYTVTRFLSANSLIPMKDPRRHESMAHHVTY